MSKKKYPVIHIEGCQIKSREKMKIVAQCLDTLEKEIGIKETNISFKNVFICPDIDLLEFLNSEDPMEQIVGKICVRMHVQKYGKNSKYVKVNTK